MSDYQCHDLGEFTISTVLLLFLTYPNWNGVRCPVVHAVIQQLFILETQYAGCYTAEADFTSKYDTIATQGRNYVVRTSFLRCLGLGDSLVPT